MEILKDALQLVVLVSLTCANGYAIGSHVLDEQMELPVHKSNQESGNLQRTSGYEQPSAAIELNGQIGTNGGDAKLDL